MGNLFIASVVSMSTLSILFALGLAFADKKFKVEIDPKIDEILRKLPGVNCGTCGFLNCHDFAEHLVRGDAEPSKCRVMHKDARAAICALLGEEETVVYSRVAIVRCSAEWPNKKSKAEYRGVMTCRAANLVPGYMECEYGCLGLGDCVKVCPFGALSMVDGLPKRNMVKCTGCGKCVYVCPRKLVGLEVKKFDKVFYVACDSRDDMVRTRQVCGVGCIACGVCVKLSGEGFFRIENNLSREDLSKQAKQESVRAIQGKCPTKVIKEL